MPDVISSLYLRASVCVTLALRGGTGQASVFDFSLFYGPGSTPSLMGTIMSGSVAYGVLMTFTFGKVPAFLGAMLNLMGGRMRLVGLTGNVACGKTSVSKRIMARDFNKYHD